MLCTADDDLHLSGGPSGGSAEVGEHIECAASSLDPFDVEALMLNLDAALNVHTRPHFFTWTQGLLQSLLRHEVLICMMSTGERSGMRVDSFSTRVADAAVFSEPLLHDIALAPRLVASWKARHHLPVVLDARRAVAFGAGAAEFERVGASTLAMHGCHDAEGEATGFYVFACRDGSVTARERCLLRLIVPFLHAAWVRSQLSTNRQEVRPSPRGRALITAREQEILKWIYLGKSNAETGLILGISPLTVKNHVQKLLHKLDVVNRAQAVGKALEAHLIQV